MATDRKYNSADENLDKPECEILSLCCTITECLCDVVVFCLIPLHCHKLEKKMNGFVKELLKDLKEYRGKYICALILSSISLLAGILAPMFIGNIFDRGIVGGNASFVVIGCLIVLGMQFVSCLITYYVNLIYGKLKKDYIIKTKKKVLEKLYYYRKDDLSKESIGKILNVLDVDIESIAAIITDKILQIVQDIIIALIVFFILIKCDWQLFLIIMLVQVGLFIINRLFGEKSKRKIEILKKHLDIQKQSLHELGKFYEYIIKGGLGKYFTNKFIGQEKEVREDDYTIDKLYMLNSTLSSFISILMTLIIIGVGGVKVIMGTLTLGSLYAIKSYADSFLEPIMRLLEANLSLKKASISLERVYGILLRTIADSYIYECKEVVYPIALEDICYSYDSKTVVLKNVNYKILLNKVNILIGKSGCGKTTIINLITKFVLASSGKVFWGNCDISYVNEELIREKISYMPQEIGIFNDTILNNITLGKEIESKKIFSLAKRLGLHDYIMSLDKQYNTVISPNGSNLSSGQCQRIGIIRTLLKDADILIFDEPTANLDVISARSFFEYIYNYCTNKTCLIVSHDLDYIKKADQISILLDGKIIVNGNYYVISNNEYFINNIMNEESNN